MKPINNKYFNNINIIFFIFILLGGFAIYSIDFNQGNSAMSEKTKMALIEERGRLESSITELRSQREEAKKIQDDLYKKWKENDNLFVKQINEQKEQLQSIYNLVGKDENGFVLIPTASAKVVEQTTLKTDEIYNKVCSIQENSPLCKDKELFYRLEALTKERSDKEYLFPLLLGITNSESSLGVNFAPHKGCANYNNLGGIKWRKTDDNKSVKDQPIPQKDGCWLYKFDSIEDYWISKINTIRFGYSGCLADNPTTALQCISRSYVGSNGQIKHSWVNNASIFLKK